MKALVTGASGFVGRHLIAALASRGVEVVGTYHPEQAAPVGGATWVAWSLSDALTAILREHRPEHVYHLASPAHVPSAEADPAATKDAIVGASVRLCEAVRASGHVCRVLFASSAEVYARRDDGQPIDEDAPVAPVNTYGVCKLEAERRLLTDLPEIATIVRPFNQIGPGQSPLFAVASFAQQIARIGRGEAEPVLRVGNLDVERDFSDIRDTALAHVLALERGAAGRVYNIASGTPTSLRALVDAMIAKAGVAIRIEVDPARVRAGDTPRILGDATRLRRETGWEPRSTALRAAIDALAGS
ncbi:MAG: GDP-mannose 4,6-dehydratase [Deltaproteobacteria bacterium]|nr:GDP-mannose 4,6-dehydratase [Deltaproteobacteria bacterium]